MDIHNGVSGHVETCALLVRKNIDSPYVSVEWDVSDDDIKDKPMKGTYRQIKEWIKNNYDGMNVSSLYVAQIKTEVGIQTAKNYNVGKPGHKIPKCPPEKRKAIVEAFKFFHMIDLDNAG